MSKFSTITIKPDQRVEDLVEEYPDIISLLMRESIVCIKCGEPYWGTIGELIQSKSKNPEKILAKLNRELNKKKR